MREWDVVWGKFGGGREELHVITEWVVPEIIIVGMAGKCRADFGYIVKEPRPPLPRLVSPGIIPGVYLPTGIILPG
jgi:hypothetical protein